MPTKFGLHAFHIPLYMNEFFEPILLFDPIVHGLKGNLDRFGGKGKRAKSLQPERLCPPKSVYVHVTSMSTCMNFLSQFQSIKFLGGHGL